MIIETSRPELIVSCVALVAHPEDERYRPLVGKSVRTPLFDVEVPVVAHPLADPEKGTGMAMICTFGDVTDVTWWRELNLPTRSVIGRDGRFIEATPDWIPSPAGAEVFATLAGRTVKQAQAATVEALRQTGELIGEPEPITHPVKFYERGRRPLEIVTSRQWYIRNGGRDEDRRQELLARGKELAWYPDHMRHRYVHWVEGLNGDWLISRQRFFGVPIPLWYPVGDDGEPDFDNPIVPGEDVLPIDPSTDVPAGYDASQRGQPGGFVGDRDVMDTWATSSLTPQIAGNWLDDPDLFARVFPMDLRPQGPDIIRTWLFATVVRSHYEHDSLPWANAAINGWILDPDRKKMSKSVGNVVTPMALFERYGTDAVRYWSLSARPGVDTVNSEEQMKVGRRLATKLLNVSRFVLGIGDDAAAEVTTHDPVDAAMLAKLDGIVADATTAFDGFDYARALERTEEFFWWFCDDYVELVKGRAYGSRGAAAAASARDALRRALDALQRLLAPTLPFAAEEAWSWWHDDSVHAARWPEPGAPTARVELSLDPISEVLASVRRVKTEAKVSQRAAVADARRPRPDRVGRQHRGVPRRSRRGALGRRADARRSGRTRHRRDARLSGCRVATSRRVAGCAGSVGAALWLKTPANAAHGARGPSVSPSSPRSRRRWSAFSSLPGWSAATSSSASATSSTCRIPPRSPRPVRAPAPAPSRRSPPLGPTTSAAATSVSPPRRRTRGRRRRRPAQSTAPMPTRRRRPCTNATTA